MPPTRTGQSTLSRGCAGGVARGGRQPGAGLRQARRRLGQRFVRAIVRRGQLAGGRGDLRHDPGGIACGTAAAGRRTSLRPHAAAEAVAATNVAVIVILSALAVGWEALHSAPLAGVQPPVWTLWIAGANVLIKRALYRYKRRVAARTGSQAIMAVAWDHRSDAFCSLAVLVALAAVRFGGDDYRRRMGRQGAQRPRPLRRPGSVCSMPRASRSCSGISPGRSRPDGQAPPSTSASRSPPRSSRSPITGSPPERGWLMAGAGAPTPKALLKADGDVKVEDCASRSTRPSTPSRSGDLEPAAGEGREEGGSARVPGRERADAADEDAWTTRKPATSPRPSPRSSTG